MRALWGRVLCPSAHCASMNLSNMSSARLRRAIILLLIRAVWWTDAVIHSLLGTYTALNTGDIIGNMWFDSEAVDSFRSNGTVSEPRRDWMRKGPGHDLWKDIKRLNMEQWDRGRTDILKTLRGLNMSGAAVLQGRFGCEMELNSHVRLTRTFAEYRWNGEDFLSFSLSRHQWVASAEAAVPIEREWNRDQDLALQTKKYMENICVHNLFASLSFEEKEGQNTAQPNATVFAKRFLNTGKVTLTCLVSGFRCSNTTVAVYRDEDILTEEDGLLSSGIRPNDDGTCQLREGLDISASTEASYGCEVLYGNMRNLTVKWDGEIWELAEPRQPHNTRHQYWLLIFLPIVILIFILILIGIRRSKQADQGSVGSGYLSADEP